VQSTGASLRRSLSVGTVVVLAGLACGADWPQWGRTPQRDMVSSERGLPDTFEPVRQSAATRSATAPTTRPRHVKWYLPIGVRANATPVVAQGRVLMGSATRPAASVRSSDQGAGLLQCVDEQTGQLLWQLRMPQLPEKLAPHSDSGYGLCSTPAIDGDRAYLVSNRGEVLCLDLRGQSDGNDGPYTDEGVFLAGFDPKTASPAPPVAVGKSDGDIVWLFDMIGQLKAHPHDGSSSSVLPHDGLLYVGTGNGKAKSDKDTLEPLAPSLIALDMATGRLVAQDRQQIGTRLLKGQWSSPALCQLNGKSLIVYGGGDGFCYAFEPARRSADGTVSELTLAWRTDANPPQYRQRDGQDIPYKKGSRDGPSEIVGTPVCVDGLIYVTVGRDPAYGPGEGCLTCLDARTGEVRWRYTGLARTVSTVALAGELLFAADQTGALHCLDPMTGKPHWQQRVGTNIWSSPLVADGKVFVGTSQGLSIIPATRAVERHRAIGMGPVVSSPIAANGVLFVASQQMLYAVHARE